MSEQRPRPVEITCVALLALTLLTPTLDTFLHLDPTPLPEEKRALAVFPPPPHSLAEVWSWPRHFDAWLGDHAGLRSTLLAANARLKVGLLGISPSPNVQVLVGRDGWLYFAGDGSLDYIRRTHPFSENDLATWCRVLEQRRVWLEARGAHFLFVIAPNKETVYPEHLPAWLRRPPRPSRADQLLAALQTRTEVAVLDLRPVLQQAAAGPERVFLVTDSHWNELGAHLAYIAIMDRLRQWFPMARPWTLDEFTLARVRGRGGDLAVMLDAARYFTEERIILGPKRPRLARTADASEYTALRTWVKAMRPRLTEREGAEIGSVLLLRDSFSEPLRPFLAEHFARAVYLWYDAGFPVSVIERENPELVLFELVERQLSYVIPSNPKLPPAKPASRR